MFKQYLILVFTGWIIQCVTMSQESVCRKASVKKEPCINGKRYVTITNFIKENGVCRPFTSKTNLYCGLERKDFCKCSAVGGLHYRTYDGQGIHFYGDCRYTLSNYNSGRDSCSFNIEVQNHFGGKQSVNSYARSIIIHMFGEKYELGPRRSLKIGNVKRSIPYEKDRDVRIFYSNDFVQFVAPKCSVRVAFNGKSNAFISVARKYSGKMSGICGNCNGRHDDLRTKSGKDVSKSKNRFARIANSYKVTNSGKNCLPAAQISYKNICGSHFYRQNKHSICQDILINKNPFKKCGKQAFVDLKSFYDDCLLVLCINKNRPHKIKRVQCQILEGLAEACSESGVPGIGWRSLFKCQKKCGKNQHFSQKVSPCPRTCENHFYGTQRPCYDLPEREGCECNKGFIRDGALCVKPVHCKCMSLCTDRKNSKSCRKWKLRGDCEKFQEPMNVLCPRTCGFCKIRNIACENEISTKRCLSFRRKGLCFHEFYRSICGLTCNFEKCKCGNDETIVGTCDKTTNIITTFHNSYTRDSKGRCVKLVRHTYKACDCPKDWVQTGRCNFCTGKRNVTSFYYEVVKYKCVLKSFIRYETCERCLENARERLRCDNDKYLTKIVTFQRVQGCYDCVSDKRISSTEVKCKSTFIVRRKGCDKYITKTMGLARNCRCQVSIRRWQEKECCLFRKKTIHCKNKEFIHTTYFEKLIKAKCYPKTKYRFVTPACPVRNTIKRAECVRNRKGVFHCKADDIQEISGITKNCKCFRKFIRRPRICCCRESYKYQKCNRKFGILTTITVTFELVNSCGNYRCVRKEFSFCTRIKFTTKYTRRKGICQANCKRTDQIWKTFRDGCKIKTEFHEYSARTCCCHPERVIKKKCVFKTKVFTEFKRILKNNRCLDVQISRKETPVLCPAATEVTSKCVRNAKTITKTSYYVHKCECRKLEISTIISPCCKFKVISERVLSCNLQTCLTSHITVSQGEDCEYRTKVCPVKCCCPKPQKNSFCNPNTGQIVTSTKTFQYNKKCFKCSSKTSVKFSCIKCNKARVIKHRCGQERNNYRKITIIKEHLYKNSCSCKRTERVIWKCCKLPKSSTVTKCQGTYFDVEITSYKFGKNKQKCIREISRRVHPVQCPPIKPQYETKPISKCKFKQFTYYYQIENCHCVKKSSHEILFSCCPKKRLITKCNAHKQFVYRTLSYRLTSDKKKCLKYLATTTQLIQCGSHSRSRKTERKPDCTYAIITDYFKVRNCKCQKIRTKTQKKLWCCLKPKTKLSCIANKTWRTTTIAFTLVNNEKCVKKKTNVDRVIKCQDPYSVVCPCGKWTNLKSIKRYFYNVVNCKCKKRMIHFPCICHKVPNKVRYGKCNANGMRTARVFKSVLVGEHCKWHLFTSYQDCCRCSKDLSKTVCLAHSVWRTTKISCLRRQAPGAYPHHQCVKSKRVYDRPVVCNRDYSYVTPCINHRKRKVQCSYRKVNCKCELSCRQVAVRPCPCKTLDKCRTQCIKNVKYSKCKRYRAEGMRCVLTKTALPLVEHCSSERKTKCTLGKVYINHCLYTLCFTKFSIYQDCRCVKDTKAISTCSKCRNPFVTVSCVNNKQFITTTSFIPKNNKCVRRRSQTSKNIECPRWRARTTRRHGYYYHRITYYKNINCKCIKRICQEKYFRKQCPISKTKKQCIRNQWVYTFVNRQIQFTHRRLCPEIDTGMKEKICVENIKMKFQPVICRRDFKIIKCDVRRKLKLVEKHIFRPVNCQCKESTIIQTSRSCKNCPLPIVRETACGKINKNGIGYIFVYSKFWGINKEKKCVLKHEKTKKIGCCRKPHNIVVCENGQRKFKTFHYEVISKCRPRVTVTAIPIHCYNKGQPNYWKHVKTTFCRYPGEYTIKHFERLKFNPVQCICQRQKKSVKTNICCGKDQYVRECRRDKNLVYITISHRPTNLKCVTHRRERIKNVSCPRDHRMVIGDCQGPLIRYRKTTFQTKNCRCLKKVKVYSRQKIADRVECVSNMWQRTHIGYQLIRDRCVAKRPFITFRRITCSMAETYKDSRINNCDFWRSYYVNVVSNCRCVKKFVRKENLHYKCCKKPLEIRRCIRDKITAIYKTRYHLVNFRCHPVRRVTKIPVCCCHIPTVSRIFTGKCTFNLLKYLVIPKNCKCVRILKKTIRNLCRCADHLTPKTEQRCEAETGRHLTINTSYRCVNHKIITVTKVTAIPVNCDGRKCKNIYSRCIHNTQTIQQLCLRRQGCRCVKKLINQRNVCCGPRKDSTWTETGPCGIVKQKCHYRFVKTFALKLNVRTKICQPVLINHQHSICRIPNPFTVRSCLNHISIKKILVSYKLNVQNNVCDEIKKESVSLVPGCHKTIKIKLSVKVSNREGYCDAKYKIIYPRNCKCHQKIKFIRYKHCSCYKRQPTVQVNRYCLKNVIKVVETRSPICIISTINWVITKKFYRIRNCSHKQIIYGHRFRCGTSNYGGRHGSSGFTHRFFFHRSSTHSYRHRLGGRNSGRMRYCEQSRYETHLQWFVENCVCQSKTLWQGPMCIRCLPSHEEERCMVSKKLITRYSYSIVKGTCQRSISRRTIHIPCSRSPRVVKSSCHNNKYTLTNISYFYRNCQCMSQAKKKVCHCKCPSNKQTIRCSRNYFLNKITTKYRKQNCRCIKSETIKQILPICPQYVPQTIGNCPRKSNEHSYRKVTTRHLRKHESSCRCSVAEDMKLKICRCKEREEKQKLCINNNFVHQTLKWIINERKNKCELRLSKSHTEFVICPKSFSSRSCKKDIVKIVTTFYKLKNCRCIEHQNVEKFKCSCNKKASVLVKTGHCPSCSKFRDSIRFDTYKRSLVRGNKCIGIMEKRKEICCCRLPRKVRFCRLDHFVNLHFTYKLEGQTCRKERIKRNDFVRCQNGVRVEHSECRPRGFKIIYSIGQVVRNCKCHDHVVKQRYCKCKCRDSKVVRKCDCSGKQYIETHYRYELSNCQCIKMKTKRFIPIKCPSSHTEVSKCKKGKNANEYVKIITETFYVIELCKCRQHQKRSKIICCKIEESKEVFCDTKKQVEVRRHFRTVFRYDKCVHLRDEKRVPIKCDGKWRLVNNPICHSDGQFGKENRIYQKLVFKTCGCSVITKTRICDCKCTGPSVIDRCGGDFILKHYYEYKLHKCKCMRILKKIERKTIHCDDKPSKKSPCIFNHGKYVKYVEKRLGVVSNCKCSINPITVIKPCKVECGDPIVKKRCNRTTNQWVITTKRCEVSECGCISYYNHVKTSLVFCEAKEECTPRSECHPVTNIQKIDCETTFLENCLCQTKREPKTGPCVCGPSSIQYGKCNVKTCLQEVFRVENKLVSIKNGKTKCHPEKTQIKDRVCCCVKKSATTETCTKNILIQTIKTYTFNDQEKQCEESTKINNRTPECGPEIETKRGLCDRKTCKRRIREIRSSLTDCKCNVKESVQVKLCCCDPEVKSEEKCVGNQLVTFFYTYSLSKNEEKCYAKVTKNAKEIPCPEDSTATSYINGHTVCQKTSYTLKNCRCEPTVTNVGCKCDDCRPRPETSYCDETKGILQTTKSTANFDESGYCVRNVHEDEKEIKCLVRKVVDLLASHIKDKGFYDVTTTTSQRRIKCKCETDTFVQYKLRKCQESLEEVKCVNNKFIGKRISYIQTKTANSNYDYDCVKKEEKVEKEVICPRNSSKTVGGEKSLTYFVIKNCECVPQYYIPKPSCNSGCKTTYCTEDSAICGCSNCAEEKYRATCPISCGICELCKGDNTGCEQNPYDEKYYRKKQQMTIIMT